MSGFREPSGKAPLAVMDFHITPQNVLVLFTKQGDALKTRRINLNVPGAGLLTYQPDGTALVRRGTRPMSFQVKGKGRMTLRGHVGAFVIRAELELLQRMAYDLWGHMGFEPEGVRSFPLAA